MEKANCHCVMTTGTLKVDLKPVHEDTLGLLISICVAYVKFQFFIFSLSFFFCNNFFATTFCNNFSFCFAGIIY